MAGPSRAMRCCWLLAGAVAAAVNPPLRRPLGRGMVNSGTPLGIPPAADCALRVAAWRAGQRALPRRRGFRELYDALQLHACNETVPDAAAALPLPLPSGGPLPAKGRGAVVWVDAATGRDANPGTESAPLATIHAGVAAVARRGGGGGTVLLTDSATHYVGKPVTLTPDNAGVTIRSAPSQAAVVSGGVELAGLEWRPAGPLCPAPGCLVADVPRDIEDVPGLRVDGARAWKARFPNGNPETGMSVEPLAGWNTASTRWRPPAPRVAQPAEVFVSTGADWPGVEWPPTPASEDSRNEGEGDRGTYFLGVGGDRCSAYSPPAGFWCANPPRDIALPGAPTGVYATPAVLPHAFDASGRPAANYSTAGAVVHAWRTSHWYTNMWVVGDAVPQEPGPSASQRAAGGGSELLLPFLRGGFQGAEGTTAGAEWYVEGVLAELDAPFEYHFDKSSSALYFVPNATGAGGRGPASPRVVEAALAAASKSTFVATRVAVLFNVSGSQARPARGVTVANVTLQDAAATFLAPHGMPSGGDWALQHTGAVTVSGAEGVTVANCRFVRNDGNGVFLEAYTRNITVADTDFEWQGDSCVASWGRTSRALNANGTRTLPPGIDLGPDARGGNVPFGTRVAGCTAHDVGIWQKQSSLYFSAVSGGANVSGNCAWNGPRAWLNFNDGGLGGDDIGHNVLVNAVRESGDHGPFNSWDRVPYISTLRNGTPSVIPAVRTVHHNFVLGTYNTQEGMDTDDGSSQYSVRHNVFVYGNNGLKSNFGGNNNRHVGNVYLFVDGCLYHNPCTECSTPSELSDDAFQSNICLVTGDGGYFSDCNATSGVAVGNNSLFTPDGNCSVCEGRWRVPLARWVAEGHDAGTTAAPWPSSTGTLVAWINATLGVC